MILSKADLGITSCRFIIFIYIDIEKDLSSDQNLHNCFAHFRRSSDKNVFLRPA